jgi:hypothetical protein
LAILGTFRADLNLVELILDILLDICFDMWTVSELELVWS